MIRMSSWPCFSLPCVYTTIRILPVSDEPRRFQRCSVGALGIVPIECVGVDENRRGFFKRNTVFLEVGQSLVGVPREHICVYTLIGRDCK